MQLSANSYKKRNRKQKTCYCKAYAFPHREESGKCYAVESGPFCGECGKPCDVYTEDTGIGSYEYWGATGVHTRIDYSSSCCNAQLYSDASLNNEWEV